MAATLSAQESASPKADGDSIIPMDCRETTMVNTSPSQISNVLNAKSHPVLKKERFRPLGGGRRLSYSQETDERLLQWVKDLQGGGINVTRDMLQKQALALIQVECPDFKASSGWVEKFLVRHGIALPGSCRHAASNLSNGHPPNGTENETKLERKHEAAEHHNKEPVIRDPPNLTELLNQVNSQSPGMLKEEEDDDDDDDDADDADENKKNGEQPDINPERLKAFNMFVRLFVDENLNRLTPISKQPKEKIHAIIHSCQRQFPEFADRARKRIRTYLKSCRRSSRLREPLKRAAENMGAVTTHIPFTQLGEVNNILATACQNESDEAAKRARLDEPKIVPKSEHPPPPPPPPLLPTPPPQLTPQHSPSPKHHVPHATQHGPMHFHSHNHHANKFVPMAVANRSAPVKLSGSEVTAVRQLINGYRESAAFLYRSADELENLLRQSEQFYGQQQQQPVAQ